MRDAPTPIVATKKGKCANWDCRRPIARGDIIELLDEHSPRHFDHWVKEVVGEANRWENRANTYRTVAERCLDFCAGLSAVNADWTARQYQDLRNAY